MLSVVIKYLIYAVIIPLVLVCCSFVLGLFLYSIGYDEKARRNKSECNRHQPEDSPDGFSVSSYLDRIEKVHLEIERDKARKDDYVLVLWLGLQGLRVADGKWIMRGDVSKNIGTEQRPIYIDQSMWLTYLPHDDDSIPTATLEDTTMTLVSGIREDDLVVARDIDWRIVRRNNGR